MARSLKPNSIRPLIVVLAVFLVTLGASTYTLLRDDKSTETKNCTTYDGKLTEQCAEDYVGLSADEATDKAKENNMQPLTVLVDGKNQGFTDIFKPAPIYFEVENGTVTKAYFEDDRPQN